MKGVSFVTDDNNRKTAVIIELKALEKNQKKIEDFLDVIIAESRKDEPKCSWQDVKRSLHSKRMLDN